MTEPAIEPARSQEVVAKEPSLLRAVSWPMLTLYGLGTTIGAGIYVIIGAVAAKAGLYTPLVFVITSLVALFSAASFAELATRYPVSSGEAAYVRAGFGSEWLALFVGLAVAAAGIISSATLLQGGAGYLREVFTLPSEVLFVLLLLVLGGVAVWGIVESLFLAAVFTLVEISGLALIIYLAPAAPSAMASEIIAQAPPISLGVAWSLAGSVLLVFYAYIGFEDMVNVAEEVKSPERNIPLAFGLTFAISTLLYIWIALIAVTVVPVAELGASEAPLALVFDRLGGRGDVLAYIAIAAVLNGVVIQVVMASRVIYGLGRMAALPSWLAEVSPVTHTPIHATVLVCFIIAVLGAFFSVAELATMTSSVTLSIFALVNLALLAMKLRGEPSAAGFEVPVLVPVVGFLSSGACLIADLAGRIFGGS